MRKKYEDIEQICAKCEHSKEIFDSDNVLCRINGIVTATHCCHKFVYDPLKRIPAKNIKPIPLEYVDIDSDDE